MNVKINYKKEAKAIIKAEIARKDIKYKDLAEKLKDSGINETAEGIANKLSQGTFSFVWVLHICKVLGIKNIKIED